MGSLMTYLGAAMIGMILLLATGGSASASSLSPPFDTEPFDTNLTGNSAANSLGFFRRDGGPEEFRYFVGTNIIPGSLVMDFTDPFTDGPGNDFAILTNSQSWGALADTALFELFLGEELQGSFTASLAPDQLFQFDLPGNGLVADRVIVTNITPDPPGTNDLATMTFDDAGVSYTTANIGDQLVLLNIETPPQGATPPGGIYEIKMLLENSGDALTDLFFIVTKVEYLSGATPGPELANRDDPDNTPSGVGAKLTVDLSGDPLETNETIEVVFEVLLSIIEPFIASVDALTIP